MTNIEVSWIAGTVSPNQQIYALRLQYANGDEPFRDVLDAAGQPVEYVRHTTPGHQELIGPVLLPPAANQQPYLQLRWKYYFVSGGNGQRAQLRLDDVLVTPQMPVAAATVAAPQLGSDGTLRLNFVGSPHRAYGLQTSTNLWDWTPIYWPVSDINGNGAAESSFPLWREEPQRFFRLTNP